MSDLKKTANQADTDELLDILNNSQEDITNYTEYKNDILTFISVFNIQNGEEKIKAYTLYSIYKVWSKEALTKTQFYNEFNKFFYSTSGSYFINRNAIQLTHEAYNKFKQEKIRLKSKFWSKHFEDFLLYHSIKSESYWLESDLLYFLYDKYTHERGLDKNSSTHMGKDTFSTYANIFLKSKVTKNGKVYLVSENVKQFFQKGQLERMKDEKAKEQKKKTKPKKSARKSRSRPKV